MRISILGAGNMGTALAHALASQGQSIAIWDHFPDVVESMRENRENPRFLPGIRLHEGISVFGSARECVAGCGLVIVCVPSAFTTTLLVPLLPSLELGTILLNVAKGFTPGSLQTLPALLEEIAPSHPCVHLAGPAIANEFARGQTASVVMASPSLSAAEIVANRFSGPAFQTSVTTDVTGAVLGGILKNTYAILLGCLSVLGADSRNLEAAATTASVGEMTAIAAAHGASPLTLGGLSGLGDLVATGFSPDSHNRNFGRALASGKSLHLLGEEFGGPPEGVRATAAACYLADEKGIPAPLAHWVHDSLQGTRPSLENLMQALRRCSG